MKKNKFNTNNIQDDINTVFKRCDDYGIKKGIAINPDQDVSLVYPYLDKIDLVLIMSVEPGFGGQEFLPNSLE